MTDNYSYFIIDEETGAVAVVDVSDYETVLEYFEKMKSYASFKNKALRLESIFTTHRHYDHSCGNIDLSSRSSLKVYESANRASAIKGRVLISGGDSIFVGNTKVDVIHVPFHTNEHVMYL